MSANSKLKLKLLYVMKILLEQSDEEHSLTVNNIITELEYYDISAERKSIYSDIELLMRFGLDIICEKERANKYFVGKRDFELAELKLLVDAVQSSKFITHKKSSELIKKIEKLRSVYEAKELHRQVIVNDRVKTMNESIYYNVDSLHKAIQIGKKVQFKYFDYTVDKETKFRNNGNLYCVSPYALTWADENYYLIAYHDKYKDISHFRVDRMTEIEIDDEERPAIDKLNHFNVVEYSKKVFNMFSGETERVELEFDNSLINVVIDRFGKSVGIHSKTESSFRITIEVATSNTFLGWIFMFGDKVRIISPMHLRNRMMTMAEDVIQTYKTSERV